MRSLQHELEATFQAVFARVLPDAARDADPLIRPAQDSKFGDYQANAAMGLAKRLGVKPRDVAQQIVDALAQDASFTAMCEPPEIAGPGFINLRLKPSFLAAQLEAVPPARDDVDDRLGIEPLDQPQTVVVDYSGPNVAKQMHVGHIRSTIIGDVIARVLAFQGHRVIRQNHVGDWGLQMGQMLRRIAPKYAQTFHDDGDPEQIAARLDEIESEYKAAQAEEKDNANLAAQSREWVGRLQAGDETARIVWQAIRSGTLRACQHLYERLGVALTEGDVRGESFYNDKLGDTVAELQAGLGRSGRAVVREDQGALCVFLGTDDKRQPRFKGPEGNELPLIIRKSDGAFLYATTDLAALRFRIHELHADRIIYVTDARQALHFEMLFATVRAANWTHRDNGHDVRLDHVTFGSILGEDRRPFKTRSGDTVKLTDLLDEAVERAEALVRQNESDPAKRRGFTNEQIKQIAEAVGIGAVKYADLAQNRNSDYVFSWDKMLAMEGNTAPYLLYAYARTRSIYAKAQDNRAPSAGYSDPITLDQPAERELAKRMLQLGETLDSLAADLKPNLLTSYLYDLAGAFMKFYETCPVLQAETAAQRASRLRLCDLTARTLRTGLTLLGIRVLERM